MLNSRRATEVQKLDALVNAAGSCACSTGPPSKRLGRVQASAEVQSFTARRRLRQVVRSPFLPPCPSDTTRASRCSGRLSRGDADTDTFSMLGGG